MHTTSNLMNNSNGLLGLYTPYYDNMLTIVKLYVVKILCFNTHIRHVCHKNYNNNMPLRTVYSNLLGIL